MKTRIPEKLRRCKKLIVTDIDDTLIGGGDPRAFARLIESLRQRADDTGFGVATGRDIDSARECLAEYGIPQPEIFVTSVGVEIYYGWKEHPDEEWNQRWRHAWDRRKVLDLLSPLPFLVSQGDAAHREFKASFFMEPDPEHFVRIRGLLDRNRFQCHLIYSHGMYLDVVPQGVSKGGAIRFLSGKWNIRPENIFVCGDSGNDEDMLAGETKAAVVGNYRPELERLKGRNGIYFSPQPHAAGVLDGLRHYGFLER